MYDNTNTGILAANTRRDKETQPTHTGSINIEGKEYWLSAWINEGKAGSKLEGKRYFSLKVNPKDPPASEGKVTPESWAKKEASKSKPFGAFDGDDDIPF